MDANRFLPGVKSMLGITGEYQDNTLLPYINEVLYFMRDAGVKETLLGTDAALGAVARGVNDLWNYGIGGTSFSPYFFQRVTQLAFSTQSEPPINPVEGA